jgi:hypothetical protein
VPHLKDKLTELKGKVLGNELLKLIDLKMIVFWEVAPP